MDEFQGQYYTQQDDKFETASLKDTRKPKFTLKHLNKLKKMRAAQDLENLIRADFLEIIYGSSESQSPGGF